MITIKNPEWKSLEDGLKGANLEDFLLLRTKQGDVVGGFVRLIDKKRVKLSHEYPGNKRTNHAQNSDFQVLRGDRYYDFEYFSDYDVKVQRQDLRTGEWKKREDVIEGLDVGDLLFLQETGGDIVGGFVQIISEGDVYLSHEIPGNRDRNIAYNSTFWGCRRGDKRFLIGNYQEYRIIKADEIREKQLEEKKEEEGKDDDLVTLLGDEDGDTKA